MSHRTCAVPTPPLWEKVECLFSRISLHPLVCPAIHRSINKLEKGLQHFGIIFLKCFRMLVREVFPRLLDLLVR